MRADGRALTQHRPLTVKRSVLGGVFSHQQTIKVSNAVTLGASTLIISQASLAPSEHTAIRTQPLGKHSNLTMCRG